MSGKHSLSTDSQTILINFNRRQQVLAKNIASNLTDPEKTQKFEDYANTLENEANSMVAEINRNGDLTFRGRRI